MVGVSEKAIETFSDLLTKNKIEPGMAIRMFMKTDEKAIKLMVDSPKEDDQVEKDKAGRVVLLIGAEMSEALSDMTLDIGKDGGYVLTEKEAG